MTSSQTLPQPGWLERRSLHAFRYRKRSRTVADSAEEAYLRADIPCGSLSCAACAPTLPSLPAMPRHLVLPDAAALLDYLEVFELPQLDGLVLLTSVVRQLQDGGNMRRSARLRALYSDRRRHNVLFDNLHHLQTAPTKSAELRSGLTLLVAAEWYYEHLGRRLPVLVVSDALAQQFGAPHASSSGAGTGVGQQQQPARAAAQGGMLAPTAATAAIGPGVAGDDDGSAELDALLQQLSIGVGGSGTAAVQPAASWGGAADIGGLLESLGLGDGGAPPQAQLAAPKQLGQQPGGAPPCSMPHAPLQLDPGVHILPAAQYFGGCWAEQPAVMDVYDSIQQSKAEAEEQQGQQQQSSTAGGGRGGGFRPHLSPAALEAGLNSGALLAGTLCVSRRVPGQATVAVSGCQLLISGRPALNRAVHGDRVAVQLLPREQWRLVAELAAAGSPAAGEGEELGDEHDLLATAGDGEADVAADEAQDAVEGDGEPLDSMAHLLQSAAAGALQPAAQVVGVLQRWSGEIVACISEDDERALSSKHESSRQESVLCVPADRRLPKIRLRSRQLHRLLGQRLVLRLDGWDQGSHYPHGHLVRVLGPINSLKSETDGVLVSSGVHWQPFSEGALRELPPVASSAEYVIPPAELAARRDLRGRDYLICSIDPPGCTDVDDALSVRWLGSSPGGRRLVEVGVHIADVSYFVRQGGMLDSEAASRCTTVYLVDRRLDMLPALLSEDLCSLRCNQDRYAVSALWTLDAETFEEQDVWFGRTLIRSRYQLEYSQAQDILDGRPPKPGQEVAPADRPTLQRNLALLAALAQHRRQLRLGAGAVELESAELRFRTDAQGHPTTVAVKQEIPMMKVVAEMMILANATVGRRIWQAFPRAALLRRHPPPRREAFDEVAALCESLGAELDFSGDPAALSASLAAACAAAPPPMASLIKSLSTRAMSEAEYFCTGDVTGRGGGGMGHFGLALPFYTHFTSPIRRYADVVAHRQLLAAVAAPAPPLSALAPVPTHLPPPLPGPEVADKAAAMNDRHRTAKRAQKECSDLYLLLLLHAQPHAEAATIYGLRPDALLVFVPKYHLKGVIRLTDKAGVCRPPLRQPGDEQLEDPFVLSYRKGLAVVAEGGAAEGRLQQLRLVESGSGRQLAAFRPMQQVWVQLSADGSRVHGPSLRLRLLADSHPGAVEAAQRAAAEAAQAVAAGPGSSDSTTGSQAASAGCGGLPRPGAARGAYRPPGVGPPTAAAAAPGPGRPGALAPPPGFGPRAAPATGPTQLPAIQAAAAAGTGSRGAPAVPLSLAAQLQVLLDQAGGGPEGNQPLAWQASLPPLASPPSSSSSSSSGGGGDGQDWQQRALVSTAIRRLRAKAARLELRAAAGAKGSHRAASCSAAAAQVQDQIMVLQQLLAPG